MTEWWVKEAWPTLKTWAASFVDKWNFTIWPTLNFYILIFFIICIFCFLARFIHKKFKVNRWIIIGFCFFGLVAIPAFIWLDNDSKGIFLASLLGFIGSVIIEKYVDEKEQIDTQNEKETDLAHAVSVMKMEIEFNLTTAKSLRNYLSAINGMSNDEFNQKKDAIFSRFQFVSRDALWNKVTQAVADNKTLAMVQQNYANYMHLNALLETICDFLTSQLRFGTVMGNYRTVLDAQPWRIQIHNTLTKTIDESEEVLRFFK